MSDLKAPRLDYTAPEEDGELERAKVVIGRLILWLQEEIGLTDAEIKAVMKGEKIVLGA